MENDFEKLLKLTEENNKMLRKIRRNQIFSSWTKAIYWIIILGALFGAYYFLQPYINSFNKNIQNLQNTINNISSSTSDLSTSIPGMSEMKQFLEDIKSTQR